MFNRLEEYLNIFAGNIFHNSRKQFRSIFSLRNHLKKKKKKRQILSMQQYNLLECGLGFVTLLEICISNLISVKLKIEMWVFVNF